MFRFDFDDDARAVADVARDFGRLAAPREREAAEAGAVPEDLASEAEASGLTELVRTEGEGGLGLPLLSAGHVTAALVAEAPGIGTALLWPEAVGAFGGGRGTYLLDGGAGCLDYGRPVGVRAEGERLKGDVGFLLAPQRPSPDALVVASTPDGDRLFHVDEGLSLTPVPAMGLEAARLVRATLEGKGEDRGAFGPRERGRLFLLAAPFFHGYGRVALRYALDYASKRQAFGQFIGSFQGVAFQLSEIAMELEAAELIWQEAAWRHDREEDVFPSSAQALRASRDAAYRAVNSTVGILGGHGFVDDHPAERWLRDVETLAALSGNRWALSLTTAGDVEEVSGRA